MKNSFAVGCRGLRGRSMYLIATFAPIACSFKPEALGCVSGITRKFDRPPHGAVSKSAEPSPQPSPGGRGSKNRGAFFSSRGRGTGSARPQAQWPPRGGSELREANERGGFPTQQGPRDWLCQTAGAAAPSGGRALHEVSNRGGYLYFRASSITLPSLGRLPGASSSTLPRSLVTSRIASLMR